MLSSKLKTTESTLESKSVNQTTVTSNGHGNGQITNNNITLTANNIVTSNHFNPPLWKRFYDLECCLNEELHRFRFESKITHVYNPVEYASQIHCEYLRKYLNDDQNKEVIFVGMNPGPNGMGQTGVLTICFFPS